MESTPSHNLDIQYNYAFGAEHIHKCWKYDFSYHQEVKKCASCLEYMTSLMPGFWHQQMIRLSDQNTEQNAIIHTKKHGTERSSRASVEDEKKWRHPSGRQDNAGEKSWPAHGNDGCLSAGWGDDAPSMGQWQPATQSSHHCWLQVNCFLRYMAGWRNTFFTEERAGFCCFVDQGTSIPSHTLTHVPDYTEWRKGGQVCVASRLQMYINWISIISLSIQEIKMHHSMIHNAWMTIWNKQNMTLCQASAKQSSIGVVSLTCHL